MSTDQKLSVKERVDTVVKFMKSRTYAMMTTRDSTSGKLVSRAMALAGTEAGGAELLFFTHKDSHKTEEMATDKHVNISFIDNSGSWASVSGDAQVEQNRELVKKYYTSDLRAWFGDLGDGIHDGKENDPRIAVIRVKAQEIQYTETKNVITQTAEVAKGVLTGNRANTGNTHEITHAELEQYKLTASA